MPKYRINKTTHLRKLPALRLLEGTAPLVGLAGVEPTYFLSEATRTPCPQHASKHNHVTIQSTNQHFPVYKDIEQDGPLVLSSWMGPRAHGPGTAWKQTSPGVLPSPQALFPGLQAVQSRTLGSAEEFSKRDAVRLLPDPEIAMAQ